MIVNTVSVWVCDWHIISDSQRW